MVTNQDGLGTEPSRSADFDGPHGLMMQVFASQGIVFRDVLIDTQLARATTRRRASRASAWCCTTCATAASTGRARRWSATATPTSQFAQQPGRPRLPACAAQFGGEWDWAGIAHALADAPRIAQVARDTRETRIRVAGRPRPRRRAARSRTGLGFFDHMLEQLGKHGGFALELRCEGDLHIDEHHTVEDSALALGQALREALGDKRGIGRYGFTLPMDEALATRGAGFFGAAVLRVRRAASRASASATCRPNWCRISSARCARARG